MFPVLEHTADEIKSAKNLYSADVLKKCSVLWAGDGCLLKTKADDGVETLSMPLVVIKHVTSKGKKLHHLIGKDSDGVIHSQTIDDNFIVALNTHPIQTGEGFSGSVIEFVSVMDSLVGTDIPSKQMLFTNAVKSFLYDLKDNDGRSVRDVLDNAFQKSDFSGRNALVDFILNYAFKKPVLLEGGKGIGKTVASFQACRDMDIEPCLLQGFTGIESRDILGGNVLAPDEKGNMGYIWVDGPLTEAFRRAAAGEKSILIIDEILRIPSRELGVLTSALAPVDGHYLLCTDRVMVGDDGIGRKEVIKAPVENLAVVASTNLGSGYQVDDMEKALSDRFRRKWFESDPLWLANVLKEVAAERGFSEKVVNSLMQFFAKMEHLVKQKMVASGVNLRHMVEALKLAEREVDVRAELMETVAQWVGRTFDGSPDPEQVKAVEKCLNKCFMQ